jgi:hypothetical protein
VPQDVTGVCWDLPDPAPPAGQHWNVSPGLRVTKPEVAPTPAGDTRKAPGTMADAGCSLGGGGRATEACQSGQDAVPNPQWAPGLRRSSGGWRWS